MSIRISKIKEYSISVDQVRYTPAVVSTYINTVTIKENSEYHNTNLPHDMVFSKEDISSSDSEEEVLYIEYKTHHRACVVSLTYILYT